MAPSQKTGPTPHPGPRRSLTPLRGPDTFPAPWEHLQRSPEGVEQQGVNRCWLRLCSLVSCNGPNRAEDSAPLPAAVPAVQDAMAPPSSRWVNMANQGLLRPECQLRQKWSLPAKSCWIQKAMWPLLVGKFARLSTDLASPPDHTLAGGQCQPARCKALAHPGPTCTTAKLDYWPAQDSQLQCRSQLGNALMLAKHSTGPRFWPVDLGLFRVGPQIRSSLSEQSEGREPRLQSSPVKLRDRPATAEIHVGRGW